MAETGVTFFLEADLSDLEAAFKDMSGVSEKEAKKMLATFKKASKDAKKAAQTNAKAADKAWTASMKNSSDGMRKFGAVAQGQMGRVTSMVLDAGEAFVSFGKALGPVGIAAAAAAVAVAGIAVAGVIAAKVVVGLIQNAGELVSDAEKLAALGGLTVIDQQEIQSIQDANKAMESMRLAVDAIAVEVGAFLSDEFGPLLEDLAEGAINLVKFASNIDHVAAAFREAYPHVATFYDNTKSVLDMVGRWVSGGEGEAFIQGIKDQRDEMENMGPTLVQAGLSLRDLHERQMAAAASAKALAEAEKEAAQWTKGRATALASMDKIMESALDSEAQITLAALAQAEAFEDLGDKYGLREEAALAAAQVIMAAEAQIQKQRDKNHETEMAQQVKEEEARIAMAEAASMRADDALALEQERAETSVAIQREAAFSIANSAANLAANIAGYAEDGSKAQKVAAMASFLIAKAAGVAQIVVSTAIAAAKALELGPIFGPPAAAAMGIAGAAQAAVVLSEPPPQFHLGGTPGGRGGAGQPDAIQATVLANERVLTAQQQREVLTDGGGGGQAYVVLGHEVFDRQSSNALRSAASPITKRLNRDRGNIARGAYRGR